MASVCLLIRHLTSDGSTTCRLRLLVEYGFMCKRCDGTLHEADLAEDLVVD